MDAEEASTAAIITGKMTGKKSTGSMISRDLVWTAMAENSVPTRANPSVAKAMVNTRVKDNTEKFSSTPKTGSKATSTESMNRKLPKALPKKMASRLTGDSSNPSNPPCSISRTKDRFMANVAAKAKVTQIIPGASTVTPCAVTFSAKLNTITINKLKTNTDTTRSRERHSSRISFPTRIKTGLSNCVIGWTPGTW